MKVLSRIGTLLAAALVSVSASGIAIAHGHAHGHAHVALQAQASADGAESDAEDDHHAADAGHTPFDSRVRSAQGDSSGHDHPEVTLGASARTDALTLFIGPATSELISTPAVRSAAAPEGPTRSLHGASPRASPRQPRAPPRA